MDKFRVLRADEIDCRIAMVKPNGVSLLLYKDARCDMNILDETVGPLNWQRLHSRDNANCTVSIWDEDRRQWVSKEDTGTESYTEKEKGLASDSFKRACFNWGIGRELYTAPFIWIPADKCAIKGTGRKDARGNEVQTCTDHFCVESISYNDKRSIDSLVIRNESKKIEAFSFGRTSLSKKTNNKENAGKDNAQADKGKKPDADFSEKHITKAMFEAIRSEQKRTGKSDETILARLHSKAKRIEDITVEEFKTAMNIFQITKDKEAEDEYK